MSNKASGLFIASSENDFGVGKIVELAADSIKIEYFSSPVECVIRTETVPRDTCALVKLEERTPIYFTRNGQWVAARILSRLEEKQRLYRIEIEGMGAFRDPVDVDEIYIRWQRPIDDPTDLLGYSLARTPFFHRCRSEFLKVYLEQRELCRGLTGWFSAGIDLQLHQMEVVRRVIQDPIRRYILADEVGLGKTIEAGSIVRQHVAENPEAHRVLILVPPKLVHQWMAELTNRFYLENCLGESVFVVSSDEIDTLDADEKFDFVVIDEAHHVVMWEQDTDNAKQSHFQRVKQFALQAKGLLLLSATPVLGNERGFFTMLQLVDPEIYRSEDYEGFRLRVEQRQDIAARFFGIDEEEDGYYLEECLEELTRFFPNDRRFQGLVEELSPYLHAEEYEEEEFAKRCECIRSIRLHLSETYRLHRRLLRNRRDSRLIKDKALLPTRNGVDVRAYQSRDFLDVEEAIEAWRLEAPYEGEQGRVYGGLFTSMLESLFIGGAALVDLVSGRLSLTHLEPSDLAPAVAALFQDEEEHLNDILNAARSLQEERAKEAHLVDVIQTFANQDARLKVVIFVSSSTHAEHLYEYLGEYFLADRIRLCSGESEDVADGIDDFQAERSTDLIICDRSAEEGLNLQGERRLTIHYDLPISPNRIEQRLGRTDRYAPQGSDSKELMSVALIPEGSTYAAKWLSCLRDGFSVFNQSIASLQYLIDGEMRMLTEKVILEGQEGFEALEERLKGEKGAITRELRKIREKDTFDALELADVADTTYQKLLELDSQVARLTRDTNGWIKDALILSTPSDQGKGDIIWRYRYKLGSCLIPHTEYMDRFEHCCDPESTDGKRLSLDTYPYTFSRKSAQERGERLVRVGEPYLEAMYQFLKGDERGLAFGFWRQIPDGTTVFESMEDSVEVVLRFDFMIRPNLDEIEYDGENSIRQVLGYRADSLLSPTLRTLWLRADRQVVDGPMADLVSKRFDKNERALFRDEGISPNQWSTVLEAVGYEGEDWLSICRAARDVAQEKLRDAEDYASLIGDATERCRLSFESSIEQLETRVQRDQDPKLADALEREKQLAALVQKAIEAPHVKIDSVGAVFVSKVRFPRPSR